MYIVSLKQFDGPLDLLLTLITHAKVDIHDIFVSEITEQYLESMKLVDELDMDSASEFLQMAATLLEIKSRAMLPKPPKPEDENGLSPEEALIRQLEEYRQFKEISGRMQELEKQARALITKLPEEYPLPPAGDGDHRPDAGKIAARLPARTGARPGAGGRRAHGQPRESGATASPFPAAWRAYSAASIAARSPSPSCLTRT